MKATLGKNFEILSFYYGPKKAYETPREIRIGFLQLDVLNSEADAALWKNVWNPTVIC